MERAIQYLETHRHEQHQLAGALQTMADGMPALGIVAAVLGVIKTMGSISEPPEILGKLIGGALVGTFLGVWISYGFLAPIATKAQATFDAESKYLQCIKAGILAHLSGSAPAVSVEFARKALLSGDRPTFYEVQAAFERDGLPGLLPRKRGPRGAHKLSPAVMEFVNELLLEQPSMMAPELVEHIYKRFKLRVHPRSVERALEREKRGS